jgi:hypothetical protein
MRELEKNETEQQEMRINQYDKTRFSLEDWNNLSAEEKGKQREILPAFYDSTCNDEDRRDEEKTKIDEEQCIETLCQDNTFPENFYQSDSKIEDAADEFPPLKLNSAYFQKVKTELVNEQEQQLLEHLKPELFSDQSLYEGTIENIRKQIASYTDRIIEDQKMQILDNHPMKKQIDNLRGLMGLMGIDLPLEAAEALAVMAYNHVKEQSNFPERTVSKSQAFVEGAGKKSSQALELSQAEKEMMNKLNISPSTYLKYR